MARKTNKKHVYRVRFYYHSNCDVLVASDEELSREEAIDMAYGEVGHERYQQQVIDGLQEDDSPDCEEEDANTFAFDKNGKIIHLSDKVVFYNHDYNYWNAGMVKCITTTPKKATVTIATGDECINVKPSDCVIYK